MTEKENKAIDIMVSSILKNIKKAINGEGKYDKTFTANVVSVLNGEGKCGIVYNGSHYTASTTIVVKELDMVRVCAPMNNWGDLFVVENCSAKGKVRQ